MVLTESQSLQLATILIEAAADRGDKQGFLQRAKEFFKKLIEDVKEKISKFASFVKDKVRSLLDKLHAFKMKLKGKSPEEISISLQKRELNRNLDDLWKENLVKLKANVTYVTKNTSVIKQMVQEANRMAKNPNVSDEEYDNYAKKLDKYLDEFKDNLLGIGFRAAAEGAPKARTREKTARYSIFSYKEAQKAISEVEGIIKDSIVVNKTYSDMLTQVKKDYEDSYKIIDNFYKTKNVTILGKLNNLISSMGSAVTKIWSAIFQVVGKIFGSFRKKKEED